MNHTQYLSLIDDTLSYVKDLLPFMSKHISLKGNADKIREGAAHKGKDKTLKQSESIIQKKAATPAPESSPVFLNEKSNSQGAMGEEEKKSDEAAAAYQFQQLPCDKPEEITKGFIALEWPKAPLSHPTEEIRKLLKEIDPTLYLHETPPIDHQAKRIKKSWREKQMAPAIPILFQGSEHKKFVQNIAKAIDTVYGSCHLVEATPERKWDLFLDSKHLKLIIAPDTLIFSNKKLLPFYEAIPQQKQQTLGKIPLLLLPDLRLYDQDPYLKRSLWNVICSTINSLPSS